MWGAETLFILCHSVLLFNCFITRTSCFNANNVKKVTIPWRHMSNNMKIQIKKLSLNTLFIVHDIRNYLPNPKGKWLNYDTSTQWHTKCWYKRIKISVTSCGVVYRINNAVRKAMRKILLYAIFCVRRKEKSENICICSLGYKTKRAQIRNYGYWLPSRIGRIGWKEWKELAENNTFLTTASYTVLTFRY